MNTIKNISYEKGINVLSLFDGMSCGYQALIEAGVSVNSYYASEIDKYAINVAKANHPDIIQLGDVTKWTEWDIDWKSISLLIAGSPCQGFSNAGQKLNFADPRSKLIFCFFDILEHIKSLNPSVKFLLENVRMKKKWKAVIDEKTGVEGVLINSNLFSAQNRDRIYWTNLEIRDLPTHNDAVISDIIEDSADENERLYLSKIHLAGFNRSYKFKPGKRTGKSRTITASYFKRPNNVTYIPHNNSNADDKYSEYRMLSPRECERLQTLPDGYTAFGADGKIISNTQRYKMLGNGWTVEVIKFLFQELTTGQATEDCLAGEVPFEYFKKHFQLNLVQLE
jgi:DNA-cytosine methyltransferase